VLQESLKRRLNWKITLKFMMSKQTRFFSKRLFGKKTNRMLQTKLTQLKPEVNQFVKRVVGLKAQSLKKNQQQSTILYSQYSTKLTTTYVNLKLLQCQAATVVELTRQGADANLHRTIFILTSFG
jgi:hypothetical protein